jgi:hypothetical protein
VIQHDGAPLVGGLVIARSDATGKSASGETDSEGRFELSVAEVGDGLPPGEYGVIIQPGRLKLEESSQAPVASKYRNPETSGLSLSLAAGEDKVLDITLDAP